MTRRLRSAAPPVVTQRELLPDAEVDGIEAVKAWAARRPAEGERSFAASGFARQPSPDSWAGVVVYEVMPDRFNNGDTSNDGLNMPDRQREQMAQGDLSGLPDWRHGGDFQGIRDRLGYMADLGIEVLWVTAVLGNNGDYHGYCMTDPTTTDPSFGSPEDLRALTAEAHRHGIAVVLDIVINHMCDRETEYGSAPDHETCANVWYDQYWSGNVSFENEAAGSLNFSSGFFPPFRTQAFFNRCGANTVADTAGPGHTALFGDFVNVMFDFNTLNQDWQQIFTDLHKYWISFADIDGFRLDAAKHTTADFIAFFSTEIRAYARTVGKNNFLVVGEVSAMEQWWKALMLGHMMSDPQDPEDHGDKVPGALTQRLRSLKSTYLANPDFPAPGLTSLYLFTQSAESRDAMRCNENASDVAELFSSSGRRTILAQALAQPEAQPDAHMWTNIDLHDWPRFLGLRPDSLELLEAATAFLLTAPGAPILYYGMEQGYNGNCPDEIDVVDDNASAAIQSKCDLSSHEGYGTHPDTLQRQDMFAGGPWRLRSAVESVNLTARIGNFTGASSKPWQLDEMLQRDHSLYRLTRKLALLRRSCSALKSGAIVWHAAAPVECGFMAFSRFTPDADDSEVLVMINPGGGGEFRLEALALNGDIRRAEGQMYVNVLNMSQTAQVHITDGQAQLVLSDPVAPAGTQQIFVQAGAHLPFNAEWGVALCG